MIRRVAIYCGSSRGLDETFAQQAETLARFLVQQGVGIVYGGGRVGLMGIVADAALAAGGEVIGVIPEELLAKELGHVGVTHLHVTRSMHERKKLMVDLSDAFIALPGGFGTLDELFETLTWLQLGFHEKPVGLMNRNGFFDPILTMLDRMCEAGFMKKTHRESLQVAEDAETLWGKMLRFERDGCEKWIQDLV